MPVHAATTAGDPLLGHRLVHQAPVAVAGLRELPLEAGITP
jgi:hypothetical protein